MEEMFTAVEFIKRKSNSELSISHFFEDKHGFGAAIKEDGFSSDVLQCLSNVTEFVSDDIYFNFSAYLKSRTVSIKTLTAIQQAKDRKSSIFSQPDSARPFACHLFLRVTLNGLGERGTIHRHKIISEKITCLSHLPRQCDFRQFVLLIQASKDESKIFPEIK